MRFHVISAGRRVGRQQAPVPGKPTEGQWYKLRQLLRRMKGIREDSEVYDYVANNLGTDNLRMVSYEEVEDLIQRLEYAA